MTARGAGGAGPRAVAILVAAVLALAASGCGDVYIGPEGPESATEMLCEQPPDQPSGMQILLAQSVPTASAVPCLRSAPGDWLVTGLDVQDGRGRIEFTHSYGDEDTATIELTAGCDVRDARAVSSQFDGFRRYDRELTRAGRYANETYFVYPGACTELRFSLSGSGADLRSAEIADTLGFVSRDHLDRQIREASDGNLHLDAAGPRCPGT